MTLCFYSLKDRIIQYYHQDNLDLQFELKRLTGMSFTKGDGVSELLKAYVKYKERGD